MKIYPSTSTRPRHLFRRGGGFYLVLAVCVAVVGGMAVLALTDTPKSPSIGKAGTTTTATRTMAAAGRATSVRDVRTTATTVPTTTTTAAAPTTTEAKGELRCLLPLSNAVVNPYSDKPIYWQTLDTWRVHTGVDFAGKEGDPVKATADGTVAEVFHDALWGDCITVRHGGERMSTYCGVKATCAAGTAVKAGDKIGTLSAVPCEACLGAHLHMEWSVGGENVDPLTVLRGETKTVPAEPSSAQ